MAKTTGSAGWVRRAGVHRYAEHREHPDGPVLEASEPRDQSVGAGVGAFGHTAIRCAHPTCPVHATATGAIGRPARVGGSPPTRGPCRPTASPPPQAVITLLSH